MLDLIGKPVVVLLNQVGELKTPELAKPNCSAGKHVSANAKCVKDVLLLDAFTRCWVQEGRLLEAVAVTLPISVADQFARLKTAWEQRNQQRFGICGQRLPCSADKGSANEAGCRAANLKKPASRWGKSWGCQRWRQHAEKRWR